MLSGVPSGFRTAHRLGPSQIRLRRASSSVGVGCGGLSDVFSPRHCPHSAQLIVAGTAR